MDMVVAESLPNQREYFYVKSGCNAYVVSTIRQKTNTHFH